MNIPDSFKLDKWYNILMLLSAFVFFAALFGMVNTIPVVPTIISSLGVWMIGFGEFLNHPYEEQIVRDHPIFGDGKMSGNPRRPKLHGTLVNIAGAALLIIGIIKFI